MKTFALWIVLVVAAFACTGDCTKCHPVLKQSIDEPHHKVLKLCIACHQKSQARMNECGADCFSCHNKQKLIQSSRLEHQEMKTCIKCHATAKDVLEIVDRSSNLIDILNQK